MLLVVTHSTDRAGGKLLHPYNKHSLPPHNLNRTQPDLHGTWKTLKHTVASMTQRPTGPGPDGHKHDTGQLAAPQRATSTT
jgi:hypothetical protein